MIDTDRLAPIASAAHGFGWMVAANLMAPDDAVATLLYMAHNAQVRGDASGVQARVTWLLRDGDVLASAEVASSVADRSRGLLGRSGFDGAMVLRDTRSVHTLGMRFAIDVAFCTRDLEVVDTVRMVPWRMGLPRRRGRVVIEAEAGAFERWGLKVGDRLELRS